ncbi:reverse transcriptase-like protein [Sulfurimonas paralvinellae]|uniref:RNase H type-1 domain-containing protein n=1 Tax=Sulfurimonas paralvinellae TaxID=317658 RepID=A0A7M1BB01_9BACT|nr:reverse transcriptase-like protein [Sulfurimonas paralvinellae]QOP46811.1 hypothetical protein FM071_10570 [Sulfurimonas paralvinellae]
MNDNVFMISDASYCDQTQCAGLGVIDLFTGQRYSCSVSNIENSYLAEYYALLFSVQIAIKNKYNNVVFVYDNKVLKLDSLKIWLQDKIHSYQFLWLKRGFTEDADALAKKARFLEEKIIHKKYLRRSITKDKLLQRFTNYSQHKIIRAFFTIANENEYRILKAYRDNQKYASVLVDSHSLDFYSDIYNILRGKKSKERFYKFIYNNYAVKVDKVKFQTPKSQEYYLALVKKIIHNLSNPDDVIQRRIGTSGLQETNQIVRNPFIAQIQQLSGKDLREFTMSLAKNSDDKQLLEFYFSAKKTTPYNMTIQSIELFALIYHLLPAAQKTSFLGFIRNRLKKDQKLLDLFNVQKNRFNMKKLLDLMHPNNKYVGMVENSLKTS